MLQRAVVHIRGMHLGTYVTESLHGVDFFYHGMFSCVGAIVVFTRVSLVKLLHPVAMGWVPTLEYMLLSTLFAPKSSS
jgi:hypothetical protein